MLFLSGTFLVLTDASGFILSMPFLSCFPGVPLNVYFQVGPLKFLGLSLHPRTSYSCLTGSVLFSSSLSDGSLLVAALSLFLWVPEFFQGFVVAAVVVWVLVWTLSSGRFLIFLMKRGCFFIRKRAAHAGVSSVPSVSSRQVRCAQGGGGLPVLHWGEGMCPPQGSPSVQPKQHIQSETPVGFTCCNPAPPHNRDLGSWGDMSEALIAS